MSQLRPTCGFSRWPGLVPRPVVAAELLRLVVQRVYKQVRRVLGASEGEHAVQSLTTRWRRSARSRLRREPVTRRSYGSLSSRGSGDAADLITSRRDESRTVQLGSVSAYDLCWPV